LILFQTRTAHFVLLTFILPTWKIRLAPNNASKWQMRFNSAFKGLNHDFSVTTFKVTNKIFLMDTVKICRIMEVRIHLFSNSSLDLE